MALSASACTTPRGEPVSGTVPQTWPDYSVQHYSGVSETLQPFGSEDAFQTFLQRRNQRPDDYWYRRRHWGGLALDLTQPGVEPPDGCPVFDRENEACFDFGDEYADHIVVTGSRIADSMTNNQIGSVDEGGVVKRIGNRVIVLRDGRLFLLNIGDGEGIEPVLEARIDLYDSADEGTWFDEILVSGQRILVVGYSYEYSASSYSLYDLSDDGQIDLVGRFLIRSQDYFDGESYAARMIGDDIVFEVPIELEFLDRAEGPIPSFFKPDADGDGEPDGVFPLIDVAQVYRPVMDHADPAVQVLVKCDLEDLARVGPEQSCQRVGFVSGFRGDYFIGPTTAYFWSHAEVDVHQRPPDCRIERYNRYAATAVYRIDLETLDLSVAAGYGEVASPSWMSEHDGRLYGFVRHAEPGCEERLTFRSAIHHGLVELTPEQFSGHYAAANRDVVRQLPSLGGSPFPSARFFGERLVYGTRMSAGPFGGVIQGSVAMSIDLSGLDTDRVLPLTHTVTRIEAAEDETPILIGYATDDSLGLTALDLSRSAQVRAIAVLENRIEVESRTHAYNATTYTHGSERGAILGLASLSLSDSRADRWWERYSEAGVAFLRLEGDKFTVLGAADPVNAEVDDTYLCEVSCVDWYGVVRPFYLNNRVFALTNVELIEVDISSASSGLTVLNRTRLDQPVPSRN